MRNTIHPGRRFGRWTVLNRVPGRKPGGTTLYLCRCDCGVERSVQNSNLLSGVSSSCGCRRREATVKRMSKEPGWAATTAVWGYYTANAVRRGLVWKLTRSMFQKLIILPCKYCGATNTMESKKAKDSILHNGIDRVDPGQGYVEANCAPCCKTCNIAKASMMPGEFLAWARKVVERAGVA